MWDDERMNLEQIQNQLSDLQSKFDSLIEETLLTTKMAKDLVVGDILIDNNSYKSRLVAEIMHSGDMVCVHLKDDKDIFIYQNQIVLVGIVVNVFRP